MTRGVLARRLMGTRFELALPGDSGPAEAARLRAAGEEALDEIERLDRQLSRFRADSEIAALNDRAGQEMMRIDPRLFRLLERLRGLWEETGGAFDPTVGPLMRAWGFDRASGAWPEARAAETARALTGMEALELSADDCSARLARNGMELDLGGAGKGYALDEAMGLLEDLGVEHALLHGGTSSVVARGESGDGPWRVAVADPRHPQEALAVATLSDDARLGVSAVHGKAFIGPDGRLCGHVLDPRSGRPVSGARLAAVLLPSATDADAWSTALLVLGRSGLESLARRPGAAALLLEEDGPPIRLGDAFRPVDRAGKGFD